MTWIFPRHLIEYQNDKYPLRIEQKTFKGWMDKGQYNRFYYFNATINITSAGFIHAGNSTCSFFILDLVQINGTINGVLHDIKGKY